MSSPETVPDLTRRALLPAGLRDLLPPEAAHEAAAVEGLVACCESRGYERIKPPLVEFEESLFSGPGAAMTESTFRVMDPVSRRMMGVRADLTVQAARIAATRLGHIARPLRLCYAGEVLRVTPGELNPERGLVQVGAELVGADTLEADAEAILLAGDALRRIGVADLSVDVTAPRLTSALLAALDLDATGMADLRAAIDRKDRAEVERLAGEGAELLVALMAAAGRHEVGLEKLAAAPAPSADAAAIIDRLTGVVLAVAAANPSFDITIDPLEHRGFEYYTGLGFSLFSRGVRGELGRGGRYLVDGLDGEGSCGFTLYMETVLRAIPAPEHGRRLYLPYGVAALDAARLREQGWITVASLSQSEGTGAQAAAAARAQACSHILQDGKPASLAAPGPDQSGPDQSGPDQSGPDQSSSDQN